MPLLTAVELNQLLYRFCSQFAANDRSVRGCDRLITMHNDAAAAVSQSVSGRNTLPQTIPEDPIHDNTPYEAVGAAVAGGDWRHAVVSGLSAGHRSSAVLPPVRTITRGPKHHWFGYYDKQEFDPQNRFVLSNQVSFEGRTPRADDVIQVGMVDTHANDQWIELGASRAWGWQQGCMLQWRPGTKPEVVWTTVRATATCPAS